MVRSEECRRCHPRAVGGGAATSRACGARAAAARILCGTILGRTPLRLRKTWLRNVRRALSCQKVREFIKYDSHERGVSPWVSSRVYLSTAASAAEVRAAFSKAALGSSQDNL